MSAEVRVWDPSMDEDMVLTDFETGSALSTLSLGLFAAEIVGDFSWYDRREALWKIFKKTSEIALVSVRPWLNHNMISQRLKKIGVNLEVPIQGNVSGSFDAENTFLDLFSIYKELGEGLSGEWQVTGHDITLKSHSEVIPFDPFYLRADSSCRFYFEMLEMKQSLLLFKNYDGARADLKLLTQ